ncbi:MAG: cytochrome b N-terminal domain-containing protein [Acidobacteria bacterium]|nr:cytochrome b N-terminal domain-containing protein [Acidobacteriota bacterium]
MTRRRFWSLRPASTGEATDAILANLLLHWFPARMRLTSIAWTPSFWLGTVTWVLFVLLLLSGLPLMVFYVPSTREAYQSIKDIEHVVSFGWWIRAAHRIAAHLMVIVVSLHLVRVFLTGAYKNAGQREQHREWNWVIGVAMLVGTLLLSFTGYLLPWDQLAFWAVTVSMNIVSSTLLVGPAIRDALIGGREIGQTALMRFYLLHIVVVPIAMAVLFAYHMWRVRKDGGLARGDAPQDAAEVVVAIPAVARRVTVVALLTWLVVTVLALVIPSPLEEAANALVTPNPAKAPWYFLWLQEIVADTTVRIGSVAVNGAFIGGVVLPMALLVLLTLWPWLDRSPAATVGATLPRERRTQVLVFIAIAAIVIVLTGVGLLRGPSWQFYWPWQPWANVPTRF